MCEHQSVVEWPTPHWQHNPGTVFNPSLLMTGWYVYQVFTETNVVWWNVDPQKFKTLVPWLSSDIAVRVDASCAINDLLTPVRHGFKEKSAFGRGAFYFCCAVCWTDFFHTDCGYLFLKTKNTPSWKPSFSHWLLTHSSRSRVQFCWDDDRHECVN